jgi:hypothetical protein
LKDVFITEYIRRDISRASFKFCMGDQLREAMEGGKRDERFSVHFNVHTPLQIVFLNNFENFRAPSKMKPCTMSGLEIGKILVAQTTGLVTQ